jgi:hypothetical protein
MLNPAPKKVAAHAGAEQPNLVEMLLADCGATIGVIIAATDWKAVTARSAMSGALRGSWA